MMSGRIDRLSCCFLSDATTRSSHSFLNHWGWIEISDKVTETWATPFFLYKEVCGKSVWWLEAFERCQVLMWKADVHRLRHSLRCACWICFVIIVVVVLYRCMHVICSSWIAGDLNIGMSTVLGSCDSQWRLLRNVKEWWPCQWR